MSGPDTTLRPAYPGVWLAALGAAIVAMAVGIGCFWLQADRGFIVTHLRNPGYGGAAWGLYIAFDIYFVGVSFAGITVSALARLFALDVLAPATRVAELLTISALIAGGCVIMADLGRPLHGLFNLPRYARPESPFYGTFTLVVAGYLFSSFVYFLLSGRRDAAVMARRGPRALRWLYALWAMGYRDSEAERRRHKQTGFWLSVTILPLLVTAHSTLGFIFGIQSGRPGWFGALQAPGFVVLAGVSGTGMVIIALASVRKLFGLGDEIPARTIRWLGNFMSVLALVYLYFMVVEELTASYAAPSVDRAVAHAVVAGPFAPAFWITAACLALTFAVPFILYLMRRISIAWMVAVAVLANVAAIAKRMLIVVPSQTHGALIPVEDGIYVPNGIEVGIVAGLFGLVAAAILLFGRAFPLTPSPAAAPVSAPEASSRTAMRIAATAIVAACALALIAIGLIDSFRLLSAGELDPRIPYSPVLFAGGVMLLFGSAIVYEAFPSRQPDRD